MDAFAHVRKLSCSEFALLTVGPRDNSESCDRICTTPGRPAASATTQMPKEARHFVTKRVIESHSTSLKLISDT
jgi:hypothetical protein